ncbi:MAG: type II secretion system F family protein [Silvanigrellaceae bacterium]|nr:type II secretion system F family protein [Silvanigrellaceae bacterium]
MKFIFLSFLLNLFFIFLFQKSKFISIRKKIWTFSFLKNNFILTQHETADFLDIILLNLDAGKNIYQSFENAMTFTINLNIKKAANEALTRYSIGCPFITALQKSTGKKKNQYYDEIIENMIISLKLGTSLQKNLTELSKNMRTQANLKLDEITAQAPVKMVFPLVFFIFPVIFILLSSGSIQDLIRSLRF